MPAIARPIFRIPPRSLRNARRGTPAAAFSLRAAFLRACCPSRFQPRFCGARLSIAFQHARISVSLPQHAKNTRAHVCHTCKARYLPCASMCRTPALLPTHHIYRLSARLCTLHFANARFPLPRPTQAKQGKHLRTALFPPFPPPLHLLRNAPCARSPPLNLPSPNAISRLHLKGAASALCAIQHSQSFADIPHAKECDFPRRTGRMVPRALRRSMHIVLILFLHARAMTLLPFCIILLHASALLKHASISIPLPPCHPSL